MHTPYPLTLEEAKEILENTKFVVPSDDINPVFILDGTFITNPGPHKMTVSELPTLSFGETYQESIKKEK